jgi:hypothetical protein
MGQAFSFLYSLKSPIDASSTWRSFNLEQCMFNKKLSSKFRKFNLLWSLIRSVTLWSIWLKRNNLSFNGVDWHDNKLKKVMWDGF